MTQPFAHRKLIPDVVKGQIYVVGDNVDTDQIIPALHLSLDLSRPDDRKKLGWHALSGLPETGQGLPKGNTPFSQEDQPNGRFPIVVAGKNFGWGSSQEHACVALHEGGVQAIIAEGFSRAFHGSSVSRGHLMLCETQQERLCETIETGMEGELILANTSKPVLYVAALKTSWTLGPLGEILSVL